MVVEEVLITLAEGAPWGFRLQGGAEHRKPLQVAKVRKRSKACRAGLRESDELVSINERPCTGLSHAQAMNLIDSSPGTLYMRVKRQPVGFKSVVLMPRAPSPRIDKEYRAALKATSPKSPHGGVSHSPEIRRECLTSPSGSEAYYGETDSDADVVHEKHRRPKRRSPSSTPAKTSGRASPEETSEMSGYDSAPDAHTRPLEGQLGGPPGVARREVVYQPPAQSEWSSQTSTENSSVSTDDQGARDGTAEVDSGFQEPPNIPPLVSPERAREALQLASGKQMVPMVGPVDNPVDEELTVTYMDKAKQAKMHRGDTVQDKQVKEARTKCRTIASLLTDAPNPHSKGVLMFKKRRQRSKKYTLTSFGSVDEEAQQDSHEDDGVLPGSESEFDEEGFAAVPDSAWDSSDYLEVLEKKSTGAQVLEEEPESPGLVATSGKGARLFEQQRKRAAEHARKTAATKSHQAPPSEPVPPLPPEFQYAPSPQPEARTIQVPLVMTTPSPSIASTATVIMSVPLAPAPIQPPPQLEAPFMSLIGTPTPSYLEAPPSTLLSPLPPSSVLNRTARPFAPGMVIHRAATAPVVFRPNVGKRAKPSVPTANLSPPFSPPGTPQTSATPSIFSPTSSLAAEPQSPPPANFVTVSTPRGLGGTTVVPPRKASQKVSTPSGRTGILQESLRRGNKKPLFNLPDEKKVHTPNPELLCLVQNLDDKTKSTPEVSVEFSPEDDVFNLGAEACNFQPGQKLKIPPPVAPKPRIIHNIPHIPQMEGKGAELFARRQSRMDRWVVDSTEPHLPEVSPRSPSPTPSLPAHWKYSSNIRAPPPIGYNPLLSPSCPPGAQRAKSSEAPRVWKQHGSQKEGIKALDFMRRQPYQLNPAMFSFGGAGATQSRGYQSQQQAQHSSYLMGASLTPPRQIPVKSGRVYEIKRFSTPTPMSAPTLMTPTVIAPRAATTLGEPLLDSEVAPLELPQPPAAPVPTSALPELPKLSSAPVGSRTPVPYPGPTYTGLRVVKQFTSAPELSPLSPLGLRGSSLQVPKPHFNASRRVGQSSVWSPSYPHH